MSLEDKIQDSTNNNTNGISISTIIATILAALLVREQLIKVPKWIQKYVNGGFIFIQSKLYKIKKNKKEKDVSNNTASTSCSSSSSSSGNDIDFIDDISQHLDPLGIAKKLSDLMILATKQLSQATESPLKGIKLKMAAITMLKTVLDTRQKENDNTWEKLHLESGIPILLDDNGKRNLINMLKLADYAYLDDTDEIRTKLLDMEHNYLVRHVKSDSPGRICHYVSMDVFKKVVYIAIKGTSSLSDIITDACGVPSIYELPGPFHVNSNNKDDSDNNEPNTTTNNNIITCHAGILDASINLVDDIQPLIINMFIPSGFKIILIGHSLGAGVACIAGVILRSRIPELQINNKNIFEVIAFAPPPVINYNAAILTSTFITSFVNNFDIIPRCSMWTVVALMSLLEYIYKKLEEKGFCPTNNKNESQIAFNLIMKLREDNNTTILTTNELLDGLQKSKEKFDRTDTNYLFVPGEVIVMYTKSLSKIKIDDQICTSTVSAIVTDGGAAVLGYLFPETSMVGDHLTASYEATLKALWEI